MFSRYFWFFFAVLFVVAVVNVSAEEDEPEIDYDDSSLESIETRGIGKKVMKILKKFFKNATEKCLKEAAKKCKKHWYNPAKVISCAKKIISIENAPCLIGA